MRKIYVVEDYVNDVNITHTFDRDLAYRIRDYIKETEDFTPMVMVGEICETMEEFIEDRKKHLSRFDD